MGAEGAEGHGEETENGGNAKREHGGNFTESTAAGKPRLSQWTGGSTAGGWAGSRVAMPNPMPAELSAL